MEKLYFLPLLLFVVSQTVYAGTSFTKISSAGTDLADTATSWSCVRNNTTGQIWDADAHQDVSTANSLAQCGYTDWRVPTFPELNSIIDRTRTGSAIDANYFPNNNGSYYLSSSDFSETYTGVQFLVLSTGYSDSDAGGGWATDIQLVRGNAYGSSFDYTKLDSDGVELADNATSWSCVRDNISGIVWEVKTPSNMTALYSVQTTSNYMQQMNQGGFCGKTNWELPTVNDLIGLTNWETQYGGVDTNYFPNLYSSSALDFVSYLSSTLDANDDTKVWTVNYNSIGSSTLINSFQNTSDNNPVMLASYPEVIPTNCISTYPSSFYANAGIDTAEELASMPVTWYTTTSDMQITIDNPDINEYVYFSYPVEMGAATFTDVSIGISGGWDGATWPDDGSIGNIYEPIVIQRSIDGVVTDFYVYRTDFPGIGNKTFNITFQNPGLCINPDNPTPQPLPLDAQAPVITPPTNITVAAEDTTGTSATNSAITTFLNAATATDDVDTGLTVTHNAGVQFELGVTTVTFSATDSAGNIGSATATVTVTDQNVPVISLIGSSSITLSVGDVFIDEGATASDNVDVGLIVQVGGDAVETSTVGIYTLTYNVSDSAGNAAIEVTRSVSVEAIITDIDEDGISDLVEDELGLDKNNPDDASGDLDGDGQTNLEEVQAGTDPLVDDVVPVFTAPDGLLLDATGYLTAVNLAPISVDDHKDGTLFAYADKQSPLPSGHHEIIWTVTDSAGNKKVDEQIININPLVELELDTVTGEGQNISLPFTLTGQAVSYPVTVDYNISGTADINDHDAINGTMTIDSGTTGQLDIDITDDGTGESDETLILTLVQANNTALSNDATQTVTIVESNIIPIAELKAKQGIVVTRNIIKTGGVVTITSKIIDPNADETHAYDWSMSNNNLVDHDSDESSFTFNPSVLNPGLYDITLKVTDKAADSTQVTLWVRVQALELPLSDTSDVDNDGISDADEGTGDSDLDGIADYQDHASQPENILPLPDGRSMQTANGLSLTIGQSAFGGNSSTAITTVSDIASFGGSAGGVSSSDEEFSAQSEILDFSIEGLTQPGEIVSLVIALGNPLPENAVYRKFLPQLGWVTLTMGSGYNLESTESDNGVCPDVSSLLYTDGLTQGDDCLRLTLVDGGEYDGDGLANGVIEDPGVIAVANAIATEVPVLDSISSLSITESEVLHLNNNAAELTQYVIDPDTDSSNIQFSIVNAGSIDSRFGLTIGMNGTGFMDRTDNSIHAHPQAGFSGTTQVQVQARDPEENESNVVTFAFTVNVLPNKDTSDSGGGGVINIWMLFILCTLSLFSMELQRRKFRFSE